MCDSAQQLRASNAQLERLKQAADQWQGSAADSAAGAAAGSAGAGAGGSAAAEAGNLCRSTCHVSCHARRLGPNEPSPTQTVSGPDDSANSSDRFSRQLPHALHRTEYG
ncbi:hypothetical protein AGMMS49592_3410 [Endomicrobiia bacterium]|nr:hypothetical protein AGMMS49592_3410 [Endomicrobiia bacterium]